jgi:hypothetical protein
LAGPIDDRLQRFGAVVLLGIQALAVASDTVFVDQGEAEAALAWGNDKALQWGEGLRESANGTLKLMMICHYVEVPALVMEYDPCILETFQ